jgi:hypothetical protein
MATRTTSISDTHHIARVGERFGNGVLRRVYELERRNDWGYRISRSEDFLKRFIAQKIQRDTQRYKIVPLTNLP